MYNAWIGSTNFLNCDQMSLLISLRWGRQPTADKFPVFKDHEDYYDLK